MTEHLQRVRNLASVWGWVVLNWLMRGTTDHLVRGIVRRTTAERYYRNVGDILSRTCGKWLYSAKGGATKGANVPENIRISKREGMRELGVHTVGFWLNLKPYRLEEPIAAVQSKPGVNDPCHCGSGTKYKKCCKGKAA